MKVISFITDSEVIRKILEHPGLWLANLFPTRPSRATHYSGADQPKDRPGLYPWRDRVD
jgi:hypothetical protein